MLETGELERWSILTISNSGLSLDSEAQSFVYGTVMMKCAYEREENETREKKREVRVSVLRSHLGVTGWATVEERYSDEFSASLL